MVQPRLIHPIDVVIQKINRTETEWDPDFEEPTGDSVIQYDDPMTLKGQVNYTTVSQISTGGATWLKDSLGRIVFRKKDLAEAGIELELMDKIISIDDQEVEYYVLEARPQGHYRHSTLVYAFFGDKSMEI